jgi:hypothetical protein
MHLEHGAPARVARLGVGERPAIGEAVKEGGAAAQPQRTAVLSMYPTLDPLS